MRLLTASFIAIILSSFVSMAQAEDDITLFNGSGKAVAYISLEDELTIYFWSGKPVAYLEKSDKSGYNVYGFNGKHLGWFVQGVVWDQDGNASCATKGVLATTAFEPFKGLKKFKPFKSFTQFAPFRPFFSTSFGNIPCQFLLGEGGK